MNQEDQEGTIVVVGRFPHPWPPSKPILIFGGKANNEHLELWILPEGKLGLKITPPPRTFLSQPIDVNSSKRRRLQVLIGWTLQRVSIEVAGQKLVADSPGAPTIVLPPQPEFIDELSLNDPNSTVACQIWIQNRASKFARPATARTGRRSKTVEEQAVDLHNSAVLLTDLQQQIMGGKHHLLGHLAAEMRASVYWPKGSDAKPPVNYDPLLLRMANMAALPLPVYFVPKGTPPPVYDQAELVYEPTNAPRIERTFSTDQIRDVQESLVSTMLRLGPSPGRTITALELIAELANTMGGTHYDKDASEFLDVLNNMSTSEGTHVTIFMCHTAEALASLSEWVLSELKTRNLIA